MGVLAAIINVCAALLIIPINKWLFKVYHFRWVLLLSWLHYFATFLVSLVIDRFIDHKSQNDDTDSSPSLRGYFFISVLGVGVIAASNLSLASNSLSLYQLCKMGVTPGTVLVSFIMYGRRFSLSLIGAVLLMSLGLAMAVGFRVSLDGLGMVYAVIGVACVCVQVVMLGEMQRKHPTHSPPKIAIAMSPAQLLLLGLLVAARESVFPWQPESIWTYDWSTESIFCVSVTIFLAVILKLSGLWVLGVFNAVTTTTLGYLKTLIVISLGIFLFADEWNAIILAGIGVFLAGAIWYKIH